MTRVVRLHPDQAEALAQTHAAAFERPWDARALREVMAMPGVSGLGIEDEEGRLAGFILFQAAAEDAEVLTLAVRPEARRRGWGLALTEAAADAAGRAGSSALWLEAAEDNAAALALYARAGFEITGRRRGYYRAVSGARTDAVLMRRTLNSTRA